MEKEVEKESQSKDLPRRQQQEPEGAPAALQISSSTRVCKMNNAQNIQDTRRIPRRQRQRVCFRDAAERRPALLSASQQSTADCWRLGCGLEWKHLLQF